MMYLGIEGRFDDVAHHTIYLAKNYQQNLRDIEESAPPRPRTPRFYVQNACVTDPTLAPEGQSTLYVLLPVTHESRPRRLGTENAALPRAGAEADRKHRHHRSWSRASAPRRSSPRAGWRDEFGLHKGATFSMAHSLDQMLHLRPHNRFEDVGGMYLVGGGTHPGSGLPVIFQSARITLAPAARRSRRRSRSGQDRRHSLCAKT